MVQALWASYYPKEGEAYLNDETAFHERHLARCVYSGEEYKRALGDVLLSKHRLCTHRKTIGRTRTQRSLWIIQEKLWEQNFCCLSGKQQNLAEESAFVCIPEDSFIVTFFGFLLRTERGKQSWRAWKCWRSTAQKAASLLFLFFFFKQQINRDSSRVINHPGPLS